jgi:hypothetical protein
MLRQQLRQHVRAIATHPARALDLHEFRDYIVLPEVRFESKKECWMVTGDVPTQAHQERRFPKNPWAELLAAPPAKDDPWLQAASDAAVLRCGPPCDLALGRAYLETYLPSGECWLYACSTYSQAILDILEDNPMVRFAGFVDVNAASIGCFLGYPVITPEELSTKVFDHIIVGHLRYENIFVETLFAQGIEREKIFRIYGNNIYWKKSIDSYVSKITTQYSGRFDNIIITNNSVLVSDHELSCVFESKNTLVLYCGKSGYYENGPFNIVEIGESLDLMYNLLYHYRPNNIYIRTISDKDCIVYSVRQKFKSSFIVHEMFDLSIVFPDSELMIWNKWSNDTIKTLRHAEWNSFQTSDFIISKRGGSYWETILAPFDTRYATVFSRLIIPDEDHPVPDSAGPIKIVYAGYVPPEPRHLGGYYDLYPCFESLVTAINATVDIYNAGHPPTAQSDDVYRHYLARNHGGRINYYRSKPYAELIRILSSYHFGWLYNERSDVYFPDAAVTVPARLSGYISAGVPVILDDEFEFLADLVDRFGAGIVVPGGRTDLIPDLIRRADHMALRAGARRLRAHMFARNQDAFHRLRNLIQERNIPSHASAGWEGNGV